MSFEDLIRKVRQTMADMEVRVAYCHDVYRLSHVLHSFDDQIVELQCEADTMLQEVENTQ
jgi:hypothetical protein